MSGQALNILLCGGESAGQQALRCLTGSPHRIVGVLAEPPGSGKAPGLWNQACARGLECLPAERIRCPEFALEVCERNVDVLLNVHSLYLVPEAVLEACRIGAFNLHPGPLPEYAGLDVPGWAIYNGETRHGVTLHEMVPQVDAGTIAYAARFDITERDTALTVMTRCVRHGIPLVERLLKDLYRDPADVPRIPQDLSRRRYFRRQPPQDGWIDWTRPAVQVVRHIRAADYSPFVSPWGHPAGRQDGTRIGFVHAVVTDRPAERPPGTVGPASESGVFVAAGDRWIDVRSVEVDGEKQKAADVLVSGQRLEGFARVDSRTVTVGK